MGEAYQLEQLLWSRMSQEETLLRGTRLAFCSARKGRDTRRTPGQGLQMFIWSPEGCLVLCFKLLKSFWVARLRSWQYTPSTWWRHAPSIKILSATGLLDTVPVIICHFTQHIHSCPDLVELSWAADFAKRNWSVWHGLMPYKKCQVNKERILSSWI